MNKGEWSEIYVLLSLIGTKRLLVGDSDFQIKENDFYPIRYILCDEKGDSKVQIDLRNDKYVFIKRDGSVIYQGLDEEFSVEAKQLLKNLQKYKEADFSRTLLFFDKLTLPCKKSISSKKEDIVLGIYDRITLTEHESGFSVKSYIGGRPTLFNSSNATVLEYTVNNKNGDICSSDIETQCNELQTKKIKDRIDFLRDNQCELLFSGCSSSTFKDNLMMIDSSFPDILSFMVLEYFSHRIKKMSELCNRLVQKNPLNYSESSAQKLYETKVKRFLSSVALGMCPATLWDGLYQAEGGQIIVRQDGEILCYHIYNWNEFEDMLMKYTYFDTPSLSRTDAGIVKNGNFRLNFQIRYSSHN